MMLHELPVLLKISISTKLKMMFDKNWWAKRIFLKLEQGNHFQVVDKIVELVTLVFHTMKAAKS